MKTIHLTLAALFLATSSAAFASEGNRFEAPTTSNVSRAQVQAEAQRAARAGDLRTDNAYPRFEAPTTSQYTRAQVQEKAVMAMDHHTDTLSFDSNFIGGM